MARGQKKEKKKLTPEEHLQNALVPGEEWPYELPEGWKWVRLGSVCEFIGGGTPSKSNPDYWNGDIPWASVKDIKGIFLEDTKDHITRLGVQNSSTNICEPGDLLLITRIELGKTAISKIRCAINQDLKIVKSDVNESYLNYYFQTFSKWFEEKASGSTVKGITIKNVEQMPFPLTSPEVQEKVSKLLHREFARLDEAQEQIQSVLDSSEERKQSILHKAFSGKLTEKWRSENNHSIDEWKAVTLNECGVWYGGGTPSKSHPEYWDNANILWITSKDMKTAVIEDTQIKINQSGVEGSSAKLIDDPAILFVMRSGILRHTAPIAMVKTRFTVNQDLKALVVNKNLLLNYIYYACKEKEHEILNTCMKNGTTVESLEFDKLKRLRIKVPSMDEQKEIVRLLDSFIGKENEIEDASDQIMSNVEDNKKSILNKAFRGELHL